MKDPMLYALILNLESTFYKNSMGDFAFVCLVLFETNLKSLRLWLMNDQNRSALLECKE